MRHDQRQGVRVTRADVDEVDIEPVDLGDELRQGIELRLGLAPVVVGAPVADELLELCQLDALRPVVDRLPVGPPRGRDAAGAGRRGLPRGMRTENGRIAVRSFVSVLGICRTNAKQTAAPAATEAASKARREGVGDFPNMIVIPERLSEALRRLARAIARAEVLGSAAQRTGSRRASRRRTAPAAPTPRNGRPSAKLL